MYLLVPEILSLNVHSVYSDCTTVVFILLQAHVKEYGLYVGYTCCQCYIIELYRYMFGINEPSHVNALLYTVNVIQMMR